MTQYQRVTVDGIQIFYREAGAEVRFYDTGHFALETHAREIAGAMGDFLSRRLAKAS